MRYRVVIDTENDAFTPDAAGEVARILRELGKRIVRDGLATVTLQDANGNTVGQAAEEETE